MREMGADSCIMQIPPESGPGEYSFQPIYREWVEDPVDQGAADSITFEVKHDGTVLNDLSNCCYVSAKGCGAAVAENKDPCIYDRRLPSRRTCRPERRERQQTGSAIWS